MCDLIFLPLPENVDSPNQLPLPPTPNKPEIIMVTLPTPNTESIPVAQPPLAVPPMRPKKEPVRGSKREQKNEYDSELKLIMEFLPVWLLMYGVYDPVRKCFYDPADPPPPLTVSQHSSGGFLESQFIAIYINLSSHLFQIRNSISVP